MELDHLRQQIDECDNEIMTALEKRLQVVHQVGEYKAAHNLPIVQTSRRQELIKRLQEEFGSDNLTPEFIKDLYGLIINHAESLE
ncbi:chorismate mutase [Paucilactobacillus nenjiangensis]|jgi:chorismate mutase|uniref:Chorismate mutase n=1 Tax=Paucilactobacillus nenjiangensis TaxID=1296540 RepID=A0A5P1WYY4_9LACO|nr:chorismate mutase [Paucilactobacillus nenjiangensis]QER66786.1 chorismate mutase [Paucilactobacillus nenjiangensis]